MMYVESSLGLSAEEELNLYRGNSIKYDQIKLLC